MKYASFFSGIGGFELALDAAGHKRVFSCEIDPFCNKVAKERFGHEHSEKDIKKVSAERIPQADLWVGGFPCQDLSVAGKRGGITEERSGLVWRLLELAKVRRPRYLLLENVPGLLNSKRGGDLALLVRKLAHLGYVGCYRVLDAQYCGVPQRRRRVFIVGHLGAECPLEVLFEPKGGRRDSEKGGKAGKDVAVALRANPSHSGDKGDDGINTTLITGDCKASTPKKANVSRSDTGTGTGRIYVASAVQASQGHHGHGSPQGDGSDNLVVDDRKILGQAISSKWSKGSSGPSGDEHHNLIVSQEKSGASPLTTGLPTDSRIHDVNGKAPTLQAGSSKTRGGTAGPLIAAPITAGSHPKSNAPGRRSEDDVNLVAGTLQASGAGTSRPAGMASEPDFLVLHANEKAATLPADRRLQTDGHRDSVIAIQDVRGKRDKKQNGIGIQKGAPGYTVDSTSRHGVAVPMAFQPTGGSRDTQYGEKSPPIKVGSGLGIASPPGVVAPTLGAKNEPCTSASTREEWMKICAERDMGMGMGMSVRRLTPTECE